MNHRLFVNLLNSNDKLKEHDMRWAYFMDIAISKAVLAISFGLDDEETTYLRLKHLSLLPKYNDKESLEHNALIHYIQYFPHKNTLWKAKDVCDFILALHHRMYAFKFQIEYWENSKFKCVPVGLPRTKNITKRARNYTPHTKGIYKNYIHNLDFGKSFESLNIYILKNNNKWEKENCVEEKIELTETNKTHWLHTRIIFLPKIWELIEKLFQILIEIKDEENTIIKLEKIIGTVAQVHWWLSHAMAYRRGSAAINDMFTKVILEYHNINTPNWKIGLAPDLEAFCTPLEEYINKYKDFFDNSFHFN